MRIIKKDATSQSIYFDVLDSTSTSGGRKTGLAYNTSGLAAYYVRNGAASTAITLATQTASGAWSSGGFAEVDSSNMPGVYRLDVPDAAFASGADSVIVGIRGATGMVAARYDVQLTAFDLQTASTAQTGDSYARLGAPAGASVSADIAAAKTDTAAIKLKTDNLPSDPADASDVAAAFTSLQSHGDSAWATATGFATVGDIPTAGENAAAVWDEATSGHGTAGSFGAEVVSKAAPGDAMALTSAYDPAKTAAQAGDAMDIISVPNATAVAAIQDGLATSSGLTSLQTHGDSTWATATGFAAPGDAMDLINAPNATAVTAIQSGLATESGLTAVQAHGDGAWATATGFAVAGDAMTLTTEYDFAKGTVAMTEDYAANGSAPTPAQALMAIHQDKFSFSISGTSKIVKKLDNSTTAYIVTLNSATAPTGATRS